MVPGIRSLLSLPAGMSEMPLAQFVLYSLIGSGLWAAVLAYAGYLPGDNDEAVSGYVGPIGTVVVSVLVLWTVVWWVRRKRQADSQQAS